VRKRRGRKIIRAVKIEIEIGTGQEIAERIEAGKETIRVIAGMIKDEAKRTMLILMIKAVIKGKLPGVGGRVRATIATIEAETEAVVAETAEVDPGIEDMIEEGGIEGEIAEIERATEESAEAPTGIVGTVLIEIEALGTLIEVLGKVLEEVVKEVV
jgi:hypothetical protein